MRAHGQVKDDESLLKKTITKKAKVKAKRTEKWTKRAQVTHARTSTHTHTRTHTHMHTRTPTKRTEKCNTRAQVGVKECVLERGQSRLGVNASV
jgi:hypothetical protein